jgi:hypothetical protein
MSPAVGSRHRLDHGVQVTGRRRRGRRDLPRREAILLACVSRALGVELGEETPTLLRHRGIRPSGHSPAHVGLGLLSAC